MKRQGIQQKIKLRLYCLCFFQLKRKQNKKFLKVKKYNFIIIIIVISFCEQSNIVIDISPTSSSTNFSLKNLSKENKSNSNKSSKNESYIRNTLTLPLNKNNKIDINNLNDNKKENKKNNEINNHNNQIEELNSISSDKNRLLYEKIKKKLNLNNNNSNNLYNNYINMKTTKDKNSTNLNKTFNSNVMKNNLNLNTNSIQNKKNDKKVSHYAAKINNIYNKYSTRNSTAKGNATNISKNINIVNKKRGSIPDNKINFNNKYFISSNKYQSLYKYKRDSIKNSPFNQLNTSTPMNKPNLSHRERFRTISINKNIIMKKNNDNLIESLSKIEQKKEKIINIFKNNKNISSREESYYILSTSTTLRLTEQIIFSRASKNVKKVLPIETIFNNHKVFLNMKAKELMDEINLCEKKIKMPFSASKIADITLNFITSLDEQEFKDFDILETNAEIINCYYVYIKLLYILFNINYSDDMDNKKLKSNLFEKVKEKGFRYLRDYLYHIYIAKKEEINIISKIDFINNEIINKVPNLLNLQEGFKICRFYSFANYLINEIINYANNIKNIIELKFRAKYFLDIVLEKIDKIQNKKLKSKQKK